MMEVYDPRTKLQEEFIYCINDSGAVITNGMVVVKDFTAIGALTTLTSGIAKELATTTTSANDATLLGVAYIEDGRKVAIGETFRVMKRGLHPAVLIDGTTDVAIGDAIASHTVAGVAAKATAAVGAVLGHALAAETDAYTTGQSIPAYIDVK